MDRFRKALYEKFELTDWFDLAQYEVEETTEKWAAVITDRTWLTSSVFHFVALNRQERINKDDANTRTIEIPVELVDSVKEMFVNRLIKSIGHANPESDCNTQSTPSSSVQSLRPIDYFVSNGQLSEVLERYGLSLDARININDAMSVNSPELWEATGMDVSSLEALPPLITFGKPAQSKQNCIKIIELIGDTSRLASNHCRVDLFASDEVIVANFREWLAKARSEAGHAQAPRFSSASYSKWNKHKILPFVDLSLWARYKNFQISYEEYGDLLFAEENVDRSEKVRKTTKKLAEEIFSPSTERAINWQLAFEKATGAERK